MFALVFHSDIGADSHAILTEDIVEGIFRSSTLTGGVNGLAPEVFDGLDGVTVFYNIQYAQGVECQDLHLTLGLVVENRSHIGGNSSDIQFALDEQGIDLICRASQSELIVIGGGAGGVIFHELDHTHGGGALQTAHPDGGTLLSHRGGLFRYGRTVVGTAGAGCQGQRHHSGHCKCKQTLHW